MKYVADLGEKYLKAEEEFKDKYKDSPQLLADAEKLNSLLSSWYIGVFTNLLKEIKKDAIDDVAKKLDRL